MAVSLWMQPYRLTFTLLARTERINARYSEILSINT